MWVAAAAGDILSLEEELARGGSTEEANEVRVWVGSECVYLVPSRASTLFLAFISRVSLPLVPLLQGGSSTH